MKKYWILASLALALAGFTRVTKTVPAPFALADAIQISLNLLQKSSHEFLVNAVTCHSCHGQGLGVISFTLAKEKGFAISDTIVHEALDSMYNQLRAAKDDAMSHDNAVIVLTGGYDLWAFSVTKTKSNKILELQALDIMRRQNAAGYWVSYASRPPLEYYAASATALSIRGIQQYTPAIYHDEVSARAKRASAWLQQLQPRANEEKVFQLLGLIWSNAPRELISRQAKKLLAAQQADGGWSQLDSLFSDAYATGQSLYALYQSGLLETSQPAYQRGLQFLLNTQLPDGSWKVQSRSFPIVKYVYSGFPHGDNQFISAAGSNWATMALLLASPPAQKSDKASQ